MRIPIAQWVIQDWQGPTSGVRLRISANNNFTARDNDGSGVEIDTTPNSYREVDCVVSTQIIDGLSVKVITIPPFWLFSTNDAIAPIKTSTYRATFVKTNGREIQPLQLLQNFQLPKELIEVFNPVPWHEIIRVNYPAAPVPMDKDTYSKEQILSLIGGGAVNKGNNGASPRVAFWSGPVTVDGAIGFDYQNADQMVKIVQQNASWNAFRVVESAAAANVKAGGNPALFSSHVVNEAGLSHRAIVNDAATRRWTEIVKDGALGLQYSAYDNSDVLQSNTIFDPSGGVGFSDGVNPDFGYFYKASSAYHLGVNAAGAGAPAATKELTFTTAGVGINKPTAIGSQLHVVSGLAGRVGFIVDSASTPSQPLALLRNNTSQRFLFDHDGRAEFGLASTVKGRLTFAVLNNAFKQSIEAADTPASNIVYKLPATDPAVGQLLRTVTFAGGVATLEWVNPVSGGDVSSSIGSTVDNRLARFDGTTGKLIQDAAVVVADTTGAFTVPNDWAVTDDAGGSFSFTDSGARLRFNAPSSSAVDPNLFSFNSNTQSPASGTVRVVRVNTTYNQSGTSHSADLSLFRTETALGSGVHSFIDGFGGAAGNTVRFRIDNLGNYVMTASGQYIGFGTGRQVLAFFDAVTPVNYIAAQNGGTGTAPAFSALGADTNVALALAAKGSEYVIMQPFAKVLHATTPHIRFSRTDATARTVDWGIDSADNFGLFVQGVGTPILIAMSTLVPTFAAIPVLPGSDPTTNNQATRKVYVDTRRTRWAISFYIPNIGARGVDSNFEEIQGALIPGSNFVANQMRIKAVFGSGTGAWIVTMRKAPSGSLTQTDIGSINWNNGLGAVIGTDVVDSAVNHTFTENDWVYPVVTAYSNGDQAIWVSVKGYQTPQNP